MGALLDLASIPSTSSVPTHPTPNQVRELLQQLAESRLTAKQVLVHPWLTAHSI